LAVVMFRSSATWRQHSIAVTSDMLITTVLTFFVIRYAGNIRSGCVSATAIFFIMTYLLGSSLLETGRLDGFKC
jgi:KUP system potassium uptake protein